MSFSPSQTAPLHKQHKSLLKGKIVQEQLAPVWFPPWGHKRFQQTSCRVISSLHQLTGPYQKWGLPTGSQPPVDMNLFQHQVFHELEVDICSAVALLGMQKHLLPHHGLHHSLQGNLSSDAWTISCPSCTDLCVCRAVFLTFSLLSPAAFLAWPWPVAGLSWASWHWHCCTGERFLAASHSSHPRIPPATQPWPCKPTTGTESFLYSQVSFYASLPRKCQLKPSTFNFKHLWTWIAGGSTQTWKNWLDMI